MGNDLLVLETPSISAGFKILNSLSNVKLLDAEPVGGGRFLILARGAHADLRSHSKDAFDVEVIESIDQSVLDAVFSLAPNSLEESLVVAETETAVAMFALAQTFAKHHGLRAIEIKIRKTGMGGAYAYFTGSRHACETAAADARTHLNAKMRKGSVDVFDQPNEHIQSLFGN
jgi:microcompartment protein CcmL/EutN